MVLIKSTDYLQEDYIGQKIAEILAIDYDENQFLEKEFSGKKKYQRKGILSDVKYKNL